MHPGLPPLPSGDRHSRVFRQVDLGGREVAMKSPDTSVEMGNTGSVEIALVPFSRAHSVHIAEGRLGWLFPRSRLTLLSRRKRVYRSL